MPVDPTGLTGALIEYGALGLFILFLLYREYANSTDRKEVKTDHDRQKSDLILLLSASQEARIEEQKTMQRDYFELSKIFDSAMQTVKEMSGA
jgi:hypothetical protein